VSKLNESIKTNNTSLVGYCQDNVNPVLVERVLVLANETVTTPQPRGLSMRFHLIDGTADGLLIVERAISTRQALACPRPRFRDAKSRPELKKPGVYLLLGEQDVDGRQPLHIGEGAPALTRLEQHASKKLFWTSLVVFCAKDDSMHKAHAQHVEARLTALAKAA
jgi:hypothetical protein